MPMTLAGGLVQIAREGGAISRAVMASVRANDVSTGARARDQNGRYYIAVGRGAGGRLRLLVDGGEEA